MQTTYIGQNKFIVIDGRLFLHCDESAHHAGQVEWARGVLSRPTVTYPNGRNSHEVAGEILDESEDALLDYLCVIA